MLTQLLTRLADGNTPRLAELSRALGVSQGLVSQMLLELEAKGYIARSAGVGGSACAGCKGGCAGCGGGDLESRLGLEQSWQLTDKGQRRAMRGQGDAAARHNRGE